MRSIRVVALAAGFLIATGVAGTASAQSPGQFIDQTARDVMDVVNAPNIDAVKRLERFDDVIGRSVDIELVGRIAIGRYWQRMTDEQRAIYRQRFRKHIVTIYLQRFGEHIGADFRVLDELRTSNTDTLVSAQIKSPRRPRLDSVFRVRKSADTYRIVDVIVDGASLVLTKRAEFSSFIHRKSIDDLLLTLAEAEPEHREPEWLLEAF